MHLKGLSALETWCKRITSGYSNVEITNMTSSWRNGLGFCAIIHHHCPDLIDYDSLHSEQIFENNSLAFQVAEDCLGIPSLLDPKDMVEFGVVDKISLVTYLAQYYMALDNSAELQRRLRNAKLSQSFAVSKIDDNNTGDTKSIHDSIALAPEVNNQGTGASKVSDTPSYVSVERRGGTGCCLDTTVGQEEGGAFTTNNSQVQMETRVVKTSDSDDTALKLNVSKVKPSNKPDPKILGFGHSDYDIKVSAPVTGDARVDNRQECSYDLKALDKEIFDLDIKIYDIKIENLEKRRMELDIKIGEFRHGKNKNPELNCGGRENDEELIVHLFDLVKEKNELVRKESELMFTKKERMLRDEQAVCEERVRVLLEKPPWHKTESDSLEEARLINKVVNTVRERNEIVTHLELDRIRENDEGDAIQNVETKLSSCEERKKILKTPKKNRLLSWVTRKNE